MLAQRWTKGFMLSNKKSTLSILYLMVDREANVASISVISDRFLLCCPINPYMVLNLTLLAQFAYIHTVYMNIMDDRCSDMTVYTYDFCNCCHTCKLYYAK